MPDLLTDSLPKYNRKTNSRSNTGRQTVKEAASQTDTETYRRNRQTRSNKDNHTGSHIQAGRQENKHTNRQTGIQAVSRHTGSQRGPKIQAGRHIQQIRDGQAGSQPYIYTDIRRQADSHTQTYSHPVIEADIQPHRGRQTRHTERHTETQQTEQINRGI